MRVLVDIEWIEYGGSFHPTQIAALRTNDRWEVEASFETLFRPIQGYDADFEFMAYNGYSREEFLSSGRGVSSGMTDFGRWLHPDDTLYCWASGPKKVLKKLLKEYGSENTFHDPIPIENPVATTAEDRGVNLRNLYKLANGLGIETPAPEHQSSNDVETMRQVLSSLALEPSYLHTPKKQLKKAKPSMAPVQQAMAQPPVIKVPEPKSEPKKKLRPALSHYCYWYLPQSKVFHAAGCRMLENVQNARGNYSYKDLAANRRPCKICNPTRALENQRIDNPNTDPRIDKVISTRLLGDIYCSKLWQEVIGYCHYSLHPGTVTKEIMKEHDCLGKQCTFLERFENRPYWESFYKAEHEKARKRAAKKKAKRTLAAKADRMENLREQLQDLADDCDNPMDIVRVQQEGNLISVFYVSYNPFADGNCFPDFLKAAKNAHPGYSIRLRHIKDIDGRFVTIEEYRHIRK